MISLKEKLQKIWENKRGIAEGLYNTFLSHDPEIKAELARRVTICESNVCGYYDAKGETEKVVVRGKPACALCGCNIQTKAAVMWLDCTLKEHGQTPLWEALITEEQDKEINTIAYKEQFKKK